MTTCNFCGKELSEETNNEDCDRSPYWHGKHTYFIVALDDVVFDALIHNPTVTA